DRPPPRLDAAFDDDAVIIEDTRPVATRARHRLTGLEARIYARCDSAATVDGLAEALDTGTGRIQAALDRLDADRLVARQNDRAVALAVFRVRPGPSRTVTHALPASVPA